MPGAQDLNQWTESASLLLAGFEQARGGVAVEIKLPSQAVEIHGREHGRLTKRHILDEAEPIARSICDKLPRWAVWGVACSAAPHGGRAGQT